MDITQINVKNGQGFKIKDFELEEIAQAIEHHPAQNKAELWHDLVLRGAKAYAKANNIPITADAPPPPPQPAPTPTPPPAPAPKPQPVAPVESKPTPTPDPEPTKEANNGWWY